MVFFFRINLEVSDYIMQASENGLLLVWWLLLLEWAIINKASFSFSRELVVSEWLSEAVRQAGSELVSE